MKLDCRPEDLREIIAAYHRAVAEIVAGFDGFVAKYMGDGVLIYFGYPNAQEKDEPTIRLRINFFFRWFRFSLRTRAIAALT